MKVAVEIFANTTQGFTLVQKAVILTILAIIVVGALSVAIAVALNGAPNQITY